MNENVPGKLIAINVQNRHVRSLYKWLTKVTGVDACWIEGSDESSHPIWGIIKRITDNRFVVRSRRLAVASLLGASLCLSSSSAIAQKTVDASTFRGQNGFFVTGSEYAENVGFNLASGDVNGDGFDDLIMAAFGAGVGNTNNSPGQTAVILGTSSGFDSSIATSSLNGTNGFLLKGSKAGAQSGFEVASGDVNGDGIDDIIIGAPGGATGVDSVGVVYTVFGKNSFPASVELSGIADGTNGFLLEGHFTRSDRGLKQEDATGKALATGDINKDGYDDILIGAEQAEPGGIDDAGQAYVVFGQNAFADTLQLSALEGNSSGFVVLGNELKGAVGNEVASGDINGDGYDDMIIGAPSRYDGYYIFYGDTYVVFGQDSFADSLNVGSLIGSNGFRVKGTVVNNYFGISVGSGDVNGDGFDDVLIGANGYGYRHNPPDYYVYTKRGEVYVVFGKETGFSDVVTDNTLRAGNGGFFFEGVGTGDGDGTGQPDWYDYLGKGIASADINGDGIDDIVAGTPYAYDGSGAVYVVFGDSISVTKFELSSLDGDNGFVITSRNRIGKDVATVDLDGDGRYEVISGENTTDIGGSGNKEGEVTVFFNTINQTITGQEGFRMLSAPTHGAIFNELLNPFWTQGFAGSDGPTVDSANVWIWDTGIQDWVELTNQTTDSLLAAGTGFLFHIYEDDNFGGPGNTGFPKRMSVSQFGGSGTFNTGTITPVSDLADGNFFFAGNPFGFTIDWDSTSVSKNNLATSIYIYDDAAGVWRSWNGTSGDANDGKIAPFQGFFVQAFQGTGSLSMGEGAISDTAGTFFKQQVAIEPRILKIQAEADGFTANAWLSFQQGGQPGLDAYDGLALQPLASSYLRLATLSDSREELQINALPLDQAEEFRIPLLMSGLIHTETALLSFEGLEDFDGWTIKIHDLYTDEKHDLTESISINLDIQKVQSRQINKPVLPVPVAVKAKADNQHRFELVLVPSNSVDTELFSGLPTRTELNQNYPNPFNPVTTINYGIPRQSSVRLEVFDMLGRRVATLLDSEQQAAGYYSIHFNASTLASGTYIYRLEVANVVLTKKLTLIK